MNDFQIEIDYTGMAATHNVVCWICGENKAVYHMYPVWCFGPCWACDGALGGTLQRKRKWWKG